MKDECIIKIQQHQEFYSPSSLSFQSKSSLAAFKPSLPLLAPSLVICTPGFESWIAQGVGQVILIHFSFKVGQHSWND